MCSVRYYKCGYMSLHFCSKSAECTKSRVDHNVNCGLWATIMCQCRFLNCDEYTTLVWNVNSWAVPYESKWHIYEKFLYLPLNSVNSKVF